MAFPAISIFKTRQMYLGWGAIKSALDLDLKYIYGIIEDYTVFTS